MLARRHPKQPAATTMQLAPARPEDFDAVASLFESLHTYNAALDERFALADTWRELLQENFVRTCAAGNALWLLAWADGRPVGMLLMEAHSDSPMFKHRRWAELTALYVSPTMRGGGLARQLLAYARRWTAERGFDRVQLYVTASNVRARAFYESSGMRPVQEIWRLDISRQLSRAAAS